MAGTLTCVEPLDARVLALVGVDAGHHHERDDAPGEPVGALVEGVRVAVADGVHDGRGGEVRRLVAVDVDEVDGVEAVANEEVQLVDVDDEDVLRVDELHRFPHGLYEREDVVRVEVVPLLEGLGEELAEWVRVADRGHRISNGLTPGRRDDFLWVDDLRPVEHGQLIALGDQLTEALGRSHLVPVRVELVGGLALDVDGALAALGDEVLLAEADGALADVDLHGSYLNPV
jgi:hypothetical protein